MEWVSFAKGIVVGTIYGILVSWVYYEFLLPFM